MPAYDDPESLRRLYRNRFSDPVADETRDVTWDVLCNDWFSRWISPTDTVLEIGAGGGQFINKIKAGKRIAVDLNPDVKESVGAGVEFHLGSATDIPGVETGSVDVVFSSNVFEHLGDAQTLMAVLTESKRILKPGGKCIALLPNVDAVGMRFFDFLDHTLPLNPNSLTEAFDAAGYDIQVLIPRFIPYTAVGRKKPVKPWQVRTYLKLPLAWKVLGGQIFVVATT